MTAKTQILRLLRGDAIGFTSHVIASYLGMPEASVRRNLNELRLSGWNINRIVFAGTISGNYILGTPEINAPTPA